MLTVAVVETPLIVVSASVIVLVAMMLTVVVVETPLIVVAVVGIGMESNESK